MPSSPVLRRRARSLVLLVSMLLAVPPSPFVPVVSAAPAGTALAFNGSSQYVTFGAAPGLGAATFTLETWFQRTGAGVGTSTGSGGITAIPLVTKGRAEAEGSNVDMNYFLGIDATSGKLVGDFEEGPSTGGTLGLNHPVSGNTIISSNVWHHAAATYDGQTWNLYLDGNLDGTLTLSVARPPRSDSIQHAGIGTAMNSTGVAAGFFQGTLDEARIWSVARTQAQIQAARYQELTSGSGLLGRWGMNEGTGTVVGNSVGGGVSGTAVNGPTWVAGFPDAIPPASPSGLSAAGRSNSVRLNWTANSESDLASYRVYRGTSSPVATGGAPLASVAAPATTYLDTTSANGTTYYYALTAVDTSGNPSAASNEASATPQPGSYGLDLGSGTAYVTFGDPAKLDLSTWTIETWFKRTGGGTPNTTGGGGVAAAIPLVTHGAPQAEGSNVDANWILAIDDTTDKLAADFEDMASGANHPVVGSTVITDNVWHHAAATYDGTTWRLYLDGQLDATLVVNAAPRSDSTQLSGLGTMLTTTGTPNGHFQGVLDEVRVWNSARNLSAIRSTINDRLTSGSGLVARWGVDESFGTTVGDSIATAANGTITGSGFDWPAGAPFDFSFDTTPPAAPNGLAASASSGSVGLTWSANTESDLAGYNLYRSTSSPVSTAGGPINGGSLVTSTSYTDAGLADGTTYYYAVAAVDTSSNQSGLSGEASATPLPAAANRALSFDGSNDYVTFGAAPGLGATTFTLETWFERSGAGVGTSTGSGGIASAIPLVTKGRAEAETPANLNMNYFLGIDAASGVLVADFEDTATGANHPVSGVTSVTSNVWHHAAATYDGSTWRLYLDGVLDQTLAVGSFNPEATSIQHAALGSALNSTGVAAGFFAGVLDEARIWSVARSGAQIAAAKDLELSTPQSGLLGRWGLNEGAGSSVANSAGAVNGTATNGPAWVAGFVPPAPNNLPGLSLNAPADGAADQASAVTLDVTADDADGGTLSVTFYGRAWKSGLFANLGSSSVPAGSHASLSWTGRGAGQRFEWYATVSDGSTSSSSPTWTFSSTLSADPVLVGAGDIAICPDASTNTGRITSPILDGVAGIIFTAGDDAYTSGSAAEFADCYDPSWGGALTGHDLKARTALPVPGNHEYGTPGAAGYFNYFGAVAGDPAKGYYGYDVPGSNWHVITLNTECAQIGGCAAPSPQESWFRTELAANAANNLIVIWHKPRFSSGATNLAELQDFWADAYAAGVDLVLVGHDHVYERFVPMNAAGAADPTYGVTQITIGTGGEGHHTFGTIKPTSVVRSADTFGVLKLTLHAASFEWSFLPEPGKTFSDAGSQAVHGAPNGAPVISSVTISPSAPSTDQTLSATVTASDPDGDALTYTYQWTKDGSDLAGATGASLDLSLPGNGAHGDAIAVRVTASDGVASSAPSTSAAVTVANSAPSTSVTLNPVNPTTAITLTATASPLDADGDPVTLTYVWKNGATVVKTTISASLTDSLDLSVAGNGDKGQTISVTITPNDGTTDGTAAAASATVVNSAPTLTNPGDRINDEGDTVSVQLVGADADGDPVTYSATGLPTGLSVSSSGLITGFLGATSANSYSTVSSVSDGTLSGAATFTWTVTDDVTPPSVPTGLTSLTVGESIQLDWNDSTAGDFASYNVYRAPTSGGPYTKLNLTPLATSAFNDPNAPAGTSYYYVTALDNLGNESSPASISGTLPTRFRAASSATDKGTTSLVIAKPAGTLPDDFLLAQITVRGAPIITMPGGWTLVGTTADGTALTQTLFFHFAASGDPASFGWTFSSSVAATGTITAYSGIDPTAPIDAFGGQVNPSAASISAPSVTTTVAGDRLVALFGAEVATTITPPVGMGERAEATVSAGKSKVTSEAADEITASTGATGGRVAQAGTAARSIGQLIALRPAVALSPPPPTVPGSPQSPQATAHNASVTLSWSPPGSNGGSAITGYKLYRRTSEIPEALIATVTSTSYLDAGLTNGTTYYYRISATNAEGEGDKSIETSATPSTTTAPSVPLGLAATPGKPRGIALSWSPPTSSGGSAITGYRIFRRTSAGAYTLLVPVGNVTSYKDTTATRGVTYYYVVTAINASGESLPSNEANAVAR